MTIVTVNDLTIGFRGPALLDEVSCRIDEGQRIGLLGRNGSGKTTFMRILSGELSADHGEVIIGAEKRVALLPQDVPRDMQGSINSVVEAGWQMSADLMSDAEDIDQVAWQRQHHVEQILSRMELDGEARFEHLSTGMKRRVLLARALVSKPDLLLLDEPTNHLDIAAIDWLEEFLLRKSSGASSATLIFVTHDRMFLRRLATRILEIDRGRLFDWSCDYDTFLQRKEAALAAEETQQALFDKKLAEEEAWIRQGIKARRTRNEGRVRALEQMRSERSQRRQIDGKARIQIQEARRSGTLVAEIENVSFAYDARPIVSDFSTSIIRGDKIGIIGANGAGKTTLLRIMLGQLKPQSGTVRLGTKLDIAYFDQMRETLDPEATVGENVGEGYDTIKIGQGSRHIIGYLQDFLFSAERVRTPVKFLSGGERNRVLLAKLFAKPANLIVLDEPTNDLDVETLELLEQRLVEFSGTVLLVSHDRAFLNNVVTSTIAVQDGQAREYFGGYDDWLRQRPTPSAKMPAIEKAAKHAHSNSQRSAVSTTAVAEVRQPSRKLKFKEQQELASLPHLIEQLELQIANLHEAMAKPEHYQKSREQLAAVNAKLKELESQLARAFSRWEELEALAN